MMAVLTDSEIRSAGLQLFDPILARLQADATSHFGTPDAQLVPLEHEERPFSHLLRVGVCRDRTNRPDMHVFVKVFKPKPHDGGIEKMRLRVAHDFEVTRHISEALAQQSDNLLAVRPIACYVDDLAIITEQADGETMAAHLEAHARWFPGRATRRNLSQTLANVGRWVRALQSIDRSNSRVALADLRSYVDIRLERLVTHGVFSASQREQILAHLDVLGELVPSAELTDVLIHADLAMGNIIVAGNRIVVLDLAMVQRGSSLHDVSRLFLQLDLLRAKPLFRPSVVRSLQDALLRGYDVSLRPDRPLFRYLLMLHRVNHLGTLSLNREPFPARMLSRRVRQLHQQWIEQELQNGRHA